MTLLKRLVVSALVGLTSGQGIALGLVQNEALPAQSRLSPVQQQILAVADEILNRYEVSYVYGGHTLKEPADCQACSQCLLEKTVKNHQRLVQCPVCKHCSLDCSHFTQLVYERAGLPTPYLPTATMLQSPAERLRRNYRLVTVGGLHKAEPGDLLVYKGHVVILEKLHGRGRGDVVHATGGRAIRKPGEGIQRERNIVLASFRGPLLRVLRHAEVAAILSPPRAEAVNPARQGPPKLERIPKRQKSAN